MGCAAVYLVWIAALDSCTIHVRAECELDQRAEKARCEREHYIQIAPRGEDK